MAEERTNALQLQLIELQQQLDGMIKLQATTRILSSKSIQCGGELLNMLDAHNSNKNLPIKVDSIGIQTSAKQQVNQGSQNVPFMVDSYMNHLPSHDDKSVQLSSKQSLKSSGECSIKRPEMQDRGMQHYVKVDDCGNQTSVNNNFVSKGVQNSSIECIDQSNKGVQNSRRGSYYQSKGVQNSKEISVFDNKSSQNPKSDKSGQVNTDDFGILSQEGHNGTAALLNTKLRTKVDPGIASLWENGNNQTNKGYDAYQTSLDEKNKHHPLNEKDYKSEKILEDKLSDKNHRYSKTDQRRSLKHERIDDIKNSIVLKTIPKSKNKNEIAQSNMTQTENNNNQNGKNGQQSNNYATFNSGRNLGYDSAGNNRQNIGNKRLSLGNISINEDLILEENKMINNIMKIKNTFLSKLARKIWSKSKLSGYFQKWRVNAIKSEMEELMAEFENINIVLTERAFRDNIFRTKCRVAHTNTDKKIEQLSKV